MPDEVRSERLDEAIRDVVAGAERRSTGDEELESLARLASGLRGLPDPDFRARLRADIVPAPSRPAWGALPVVSWFRGQRVFLAGGASTGVVAGGCCLIGATARVLGIASAAAVTDFINSTLPYFVALSIVSMVAWLVWLLRDRLSPVTFGRMVWQHGVALGGAYGAVFGASMVLTMAMGLQ